MEYIDPMKYLLTLGLAFAFGMGATWAQSNPLLGKWKTKDDETGRIKTIVEITERDGRMKLRGEEWTARLDPDITLEPVGSGTKLVVTRIDGATALVHPID